MKGVIALDIDGTVTTRQNEIPQDVRCFLRDLVHDGWQIVFITGRPFYSAINCLSDLEFHPYVAAQNGSVLIDFSTKEVIERAYLNTSLIPTMDKLCTDLPCDYLIYSGFEQKDRAYFRPHRFDEFWLNYVDARFSSFGELCTKVDSFDELPCESFPVVKCFGVDEAIWGLAEKIEKELGVQAPVIKDPYNHDYYVMQATHNAVNKGWALKRIIELMGWKGPVIACGDDANDRPMLQAADWALVMGSAPQSMHEMAHVIAPPASEMGIIEGLRKVIAQAK